MAKRLSSSQIAALTAAQAPEAVKDAFGSDKQLTMLDVLLLEKVGCTFMATGSAPSSTELLATYWCVSDRDAFMSAARSDDFQSLFHAYAEGISPAELLQATPLVTEVLRRTFSPASNSSGKA